MISSLCWLPRGAAKENPTRFAPSDEQLAALRMFVKAKPESEAASSSNADDDDVADDSDEVSKKYGLDNYDKEDTLAAQVNDDFLDNRVLQPDPNLHNSDEDSEDEDDRLSFAIQPSDDILLVANVSEEDLSTLEVYVYEADKDNLYQHHEVLLPAMPLCVEWMDFFPGSSPSDGSRNRGSIAAVGSFIPGIELWDLDVIDQLEPLCVLGATITDLPPSAASSSSSSSEMSTSTSPYYDKKLEYSASAHTAPVLGLSWNSTYRQLLASGSADKTVKLWDLSNGKVLQTLKHHRDKVQSVQWNPRMAHVLLTGGYDRRVCIVDNKSKSISHTWKLPADIESVAWNPHEPNIFLASAEDGSVTAFDLRSPAKTLFNLPAHKKECTAVAFNPQVANLFATASADKVVKLWAVQNGRPVCLQSFNSPCDKVFSTSFCRGAPFVAAVGGSKVEIVDISQFQSVKNFIKDPSAPIATPGAAVRPPKGAPSGPVMLRKPRSGLTRPRSKKR